MKRTKYAVHIGDDVARFSKHQHAYQFAEAVSKRYPDKLVEISVHAGLIGQCRNGQPTPEFKQHHINGMFE